MFFKPLTCFGLAVVAAGRTVNVYELSKFFSASTGSSSFASILQAPASDAIEIEVQERGTSIWEDEEHEVLRPGALGGGAFGAVWECSDYPGSDDYAVKIIDFERPMSGMS